MPVNICFWPWALSLLVTPAESNIGEIVIGLTLSRTGPKTEVSVSRDIEDGLALFVERANEVGEFKDHNGAPWTLRLHISDDGGDPEKVAALYEEMISNRLADVFLAPCCVHLTLRAASVANELNRTIMTYVPYHVDKEFPFTADKQQGVFSAFSGLRAPYEDTLTHLEDRGMSSVAVLSGPERQHTTACDLFAEKANESDFQVMLSEVMTDGVSALSSMQKILALKPDIVVACGQAIDVSMMVTAATRLNWRPKEVVVRTDIDSLVETIGQKAKLFMVPTSWTKDRNTSCDVNNSCPLFGSSANFGQLFSNRSRSGKEPSELVAIAVAGAIAMMSAVESIVYQGTESDKHARLTQALLHNVSTESMYGKLQFRRSGADACNLEESNEGFTIQIDKVSQTGAGFKLLPWWGGGEPGAQEEPSWSHSEVGCGVGEVSRGGGCKKCPAGTTNLSYHGENVACLACAPGKHSPFRGSACQPCPDGADCRDRGTVEPVSSPGYYKLPLTDQNGELYMKCLPESICTGNNECSGNSTGFLCMQCKEGNTNTGILRQTQCEQCSSRVALVGFMLLWVLILVVVAIVSKQPTLIGKLTKRTISYIQLTSAAVKAGQLYKSSVFFGPFADIFLEPFQTIFGPDCLLRTTSLSRLAGVSTPEQFSMVLGIVMLPGILLLTGVPVLIYRCWLSGTRRNRSNHLARAIDKNTEDPSRATLLEWTIVWSYLLYCPTVRMLLSNFDMMQAGGFRFRRNPDVLIADAQSTIVGVFFVVVYGLGVPIAQHFTLQWLRSNGRTTTSWWLHCYNMMTFEFKPEFWFTEGILFALKFLYMGVLCLPRESARIFTLSGIVFAHSLLLTLLKPFDESRSLLSLELSCVFSLVCILGTSSYLQGTRGAMLLDPAFEWPGYVLIWCAHALFISGVLKAWYRHSMMGPLIVKAVAMPDSLTKLERRMVKMGQDRMFKWNSKMQCLDYASLNKQLAIQLEETVASLLTGYIDSGNSFHSSYLVTALDEALKECIANRRRRLIQMHPSILRSMQQTGFFSGFTRLLPVWHEESHVDARQLRLNQRSLLLALPRVSNEMATIEELRFVLAQQRHFILNNTSTFFAVKEIPHHLRASEDGGDGGDGEAEAETPRQRSLRAAMMNAGATPSQKLEQLRRHELEGVLASEDEMAAQRRMHARIPELTEEVDELRTEIVMLKERVAESEAKLAAAGVRTVVV